MKARVGQGGEASDRKNDNRKKHNAIIRGLCILNFDNGYKRAKRQAEEKPLEENHPLAKD